MSSEEKKPVNLTSRDLEGLSGAERRRLLEKLMRQKQAKPRFFPLSFPQQQLWFLDQLEGDTPAYHVSQLYALRG
ncbi:MAG: hypothetical protein SX243_10430, partial [Acidobacteriota bacterium]|nr:hypothetical protein [Acidobacteriota bacterium]